MCKVPVVGVSWAGVRHGQPDREVGVNRLNQKPEEDVQGEAGATLRTVRIPDQCGSVDWVLYRKAKGLWFNSQSGHMPGLGVQSPARVHARGNQSMFLLH